MIATMAPAGRDFVFAYGADMSGWPTGFGWFLAIVLAFGAGLWLLLARSTLVRGGSMERPERVPQLYGYTVCLIAIVVMLASVSNIVEQSFAIADPIASVRSFGWGGEPSLTSFEAYKATRNNGVIPATMMNGEAAPRAEPTESELRARYDALRADRMRSVNRNAQRELTESGLLLLIAAALFWWHWRWVRGSQMRALAGALTRE